MSPSRQINYYDLHTGVWYQSYIDDGDYPDPLMVQFGVFAIFSNYTSFGRIILN